LRTLNWLAPPRELRSRNTQSAPGTDRGHYRGGGGEDQQAPRARCFFLSSSRRRPGPSQGSPRWLVLVISRQRILSRMRKLKLWVPYHLHGLIGETAPVEACLGPGLRRDDVKGWAARGARKFPAELSLRSVARVCFPHPVSSGGALWRRLWCVRREQAGAPRRNAAGDPQG
jgi:hypothetical protein